ncbi:MAG TPA: hypothetical protein VED40_11620 [Azospirillaceae bacterium]|nr:hypothetical protein [Azospirillaceae bacterium]
MKTMLPTLPVLALLGALAVHLPAAPALAGGMPGETPLSGGPLSGSLGCRVPDLILTAGRDLDGTAEEVAASRAELVRFEACLDARAEAAEVLDPDAVTRLALQRDAAVTLRRLLDAFGEAIAEARARSVPGS